MFTKAITTVAILAGSALAQNCGQAIVENQCDYDVHLFNTPAEGGGYDQITQVIPTGSSYSQTWTQLSNGMGWSLKLSPNSSMENIMQYEYTFHNDGIIWYDLSDVNGNPWNGNWEVQATGSDSCHPKQQAYCYATDDAYGMQACPAEAVIKVTLCSRAEVGNYACNSASAAATSYVSTAASSAAPSSYSAPSSTEAPSSYAAPSTTEAASTSSFTTPSASAPSWMSPHTWDVVPSATSTEESSSATPTSTFVSPTTFATSSTAVISQAPGVTVTDIDTAIVTDIVTMTAYGKRHEHHARHPHHRHA